MPKINLPKSVKKVYKREYVSSKKDNLINRIIYNTTLWKLLRLEKLKLNPLCERCLAKGIIKSGIEVHHRIPISKGVTIQDKQKLGFKFDNLETLCIECHLEEHRNNNSFE